MRLLFLSGLVALQVCAVAEEEPAVAPPAFVTNCQACHFVDRALVGPSLVEIAEIYPEKERGKFVQWCIDPGKKRDQMPQMPSMAHVSQVELNEIFDYVQSVTIGVKRVKVPSTDPYASSPSAGKRPRVQRTFVPEAGPASMVITLPTEDKLNVVWDTDECRLRYISSGKFDNWPYLRSNGNALANVGTILYRESVPLFAGSSVQFLGYALSDGGYPTLEYSVNGTRVSETIIVNGESVQRLIKSSSPLPLVNAPMDQGAHLKVEMTVSDKRLLLTHTKLK